MHIERLQVEDGFLDGLDLTFSEGLNALIGARGTGKTSVIELIRFCLGVSGHTPESSKRTREHALSVLRGGQVTVTLADRGQRVVVTRSAEQLEPVSSSPFPRPIILSQTEIETVGLQPAGRLRLLDEFVAGQGTFARDEAAQAAIVRSLTAEAAAIRRDVAEHEDRLRLLPEVTRKLEELAPKELELAKISAEAAEKASKLEVLSAHGSQIAVISDHVSRYQAWAQRWLEGITHSLSTLSTEEPWVGEAPDPLANIRPRRERARKHLEAAAEEIAQLIRESQQIHDGNASQKFAIDENSRELRREVEALKAGAGEVARQAQKLRQEQAQLEALKVVIEDRRKALNGFIEKRGAALDQLETARAMRFEARSKVAREMSKRLAPRIRVEVVRAAQIDAYVSALTDALRGSGLKYSDIVNPLASSVTPRELLDIVDTFDVDRLCASMQIARDRAGRLLSSLREADLGLISTILIDDEVHFQLLDGGDYKDISDLSTGQRCTVVLPIILLHKETVLIIDQPEDHIDNAFVADTLVRAILDRGGAGQMILSTHNANIPVLGDASKVIQLRSDGRRGFVSVAADLENPEVVGAISTVMEGGVEAFQRRADFYARHPNGR